MTPLPSESTTDRIRLGAVWKFDLDAYRAEQTLEVPAGALPLSVQLRDGQPTLWALVDPTPGLARQQITVRLVGTGWDIFGLDQWTFLGTVQTGGGLVFHYFLQEAP